MSDDDLDELITNLHSSDEKLCLRSIELLGQSEDERALEPLMESAVQTSNYTVRYQARNALEKLSHTPHIIDLLIDKLMEEASIERTELVANLLQRTADSGVAELLMAIWKKHPDSGELQDYATWAAIRCQCFSVREYCNAEKVNVLVVDDDAATRGFLRLLLRSQKFSAITAEDGLDGYEFAKICQPDVVILDLRMPRLDGFGACRKIKADETTQKIPVILLSAWGSTDIVAEGLEAGAEEYLTKPCPPTVLISKIKSVLQKSRLGIYDKTD